MNVCRCIFLIIIFARLCESQVVKNQFLFCYTFTWSLHSNLDKIKCKSDMLLSCLHFFSEFLLKIKSKLVSLMACRFWADACLPFQPYLLPALFPMSIQQFTEILAVGEYTINCFPPYFVILFPLSEMTCSSFPFSFCFRYHFLCKISLVHWPPFTCSQVPLQWTLLCWKYWLVLEVSTPELTWSSLNTLELPAPEIS